MKNSGKEMLVNLAVCDVRVLERNYDPFQSLLVILDLHTPISHNVLQGSMGYLYEYNQSSCRPLPVFLQSSSKLLN
jgi:hypothetical protein